MEILHINANYLVSELHQTMIDTLEKLGINGDVFVPTVEGNLERVPFHLNENVKLVPCTKKIDRFFYYIKQHKVFKKLESNFDINKYDCIHAYTLFSDGTSAWKAWKKYNIPYVVAVRNTDINRFLKFKPYLKKRAEIIMENASAIFFLSEPYIEQMKGIVTEDAWDKIKDKTHLITNGINQMWLDNRAVERDIQVNLARFKKREVRLLYIGKIDDNRNTSLTLQACELLIDQGWNVEYTVVGRVKREDEFQLLKSKDFVKYSDAKPMQDLIGIYRANDIFVMPSHTETFGLVYAEAMSQGLPVIYTRGQGFDGQFGDGKVGYAVSDTDPKELASRILSCIENYEAISRFNVEQVDRYDWNQICKRYVKIYNGIRNENC